MICYPSFLGVIFVLRVIVVYRIFDANVVKRQLEEHDEEICAMVAKEVFPRQISIESHEEFKQLSYPLAI